MLIAFAGLPGVGKSTLARAFARERGAAYLRVDEIEQALRGSGTLSGEVGPAGYVVAYALARSNLRLGLTVVADCVNPLRITRDAWRRVAAEAGVPLAEVEVVCSDPAEHRSRVETRAADIEGLRLPGWADVADRTYEPWDRPRLVVDTAGVSPEHALLLLRAALSGA